MILFTFRTLGIALHVYHHEERFDTALIEALKETEDTLGRLESTMNEVKEATLKNQSYLQKILYEKGLKMIESRFVVVVLSKVCLKIFVCYFNFQT